VGSERQSLLVQHRLTLGILRQKPRFMAAKLTVPPQNRPDCSFGAGQVHHVATLDDGADAEAKFVQRSHVVR
jgi:hypothetical protein